MFGIKFAVALTAAAIVATGCTAPPSSDGTAPSGAATVTLRMANWAGTAHHMYHYTLPRWFAEVERQTQGRVHIDYDTVMITKSSGLYGLARDGVRDMAWSSGSQNPVDFPLIRFVEAPFGPLDDAVQSSVIFDRWYHDKHHLDQREMRDVKYLFSWHYGPSMIHAKKRITSLADLRGLRIRAQSTDAVIAQALGAIPIIIGAVKSHDALENGTLDATFFPMEAMQSFRLFNLVKYHVKFPRHAFSVNGFYMAMNLEKFDGLPADLRDGLLRAAAKGPEIVAAGWAEFDRRAAATAKSLGHEIYAISEDEAARWKDKVLRAGALQVIVGRAERAGHRDAAALLQDLLRLWDNARGPAPEGTKPERTI
jgi:TRAP-type C4-dicarboxylate transport system substrate-binding protein